MKFLIPVYAIAVSCLLVACGSSNDQPDDPVQPTSQASGDHYVPPRSSANPVSGRSTPEEIDRRREQAMAEAARREQELSGPTPQQLSEIWMLEQLVATEKRGGGNSDYVGFQQEMLVVDQQRRYLLTSVNELRQEIDAIENRERAWRAGVAPDGDLGKVFIHRSDFSFKTDRLDFLLENTVLHVRNSGPHAIGHVWIHAEIHSDQWEDFSESIDFEFTPPQPLLAGQTASWPISLNALVSGLYGKKKRYGRGNFGTISNYAIASSTQLGYRAWITSYDGGGGQPLPGVEIPLHDHRRLDAIRKELPSQQDRLNHHEREYQRLLKSLNASRPNQKSERELELERKKREYGITDDDRQSAPSAPIRSTRNQTQATSPPARRDAPERSTPAPSRRPHVVAVLPTATPPGPARASAASPTPMPRVPATPSDESLRRWKEELQRAEGTPLYQQAQDLLSEASRLWNLSDYNGAIEAAQGAWNRKRNTFTPDNPELTKIEDMIEQARAIAYRNWKDGIAERDFNDADPAEWATDVESFRAAITGRLRGIENPDEALKALAAFVGREVSWTVTRLRYSPRMGKELSFYEQTTPVPGPAHTTEQLTRVRIGLRVIPSVDGVDRFVDIGRISPNFPEYKPRHQFTARISGFTLKKSIRVDWDVFPGWTTQVLLEDARPLD